MRLPSKSPVLLKVLRAERLASLALGRLHHEYNLGKTLELPSIARPLALGSWRDQPALVLEGDGVTLAELLERYRHPENFLPMAIRLASALVELHSHQVIHRDLKPENVLVHPSTNEIRLCGLGLATLLPSERRVSLLPHLVEGSLAYMSPEQTGRLNRALDSRTDLYSLGIIFYQLLTGELPFQADDPAEWIHSHIACQPPPLHERAPEVPLALSEVVLKLLAKSPDERYQSALGLQRDLEQCLRQMLTQGSGVPFPLGRYDVPDQFRVPQQLYGRGEELGELLSAFEQVVRGGPPSWCW